MTRPVTDMRRSSKAALTALPLLLPGAVRAHSTGADGWLTLDLLAVSGIAAAGIAYGLTRRHGRPWRAVCFFAGLGTLVLALVWPLDALSERSFAAHMGQHMLLIALAPPLLALGAPLAPLHRALAYVPWQRLTRPSAAFALHAAIVWAWHAPGPFQAALRSDAWHMLEHLSMLFSALLFWWSLLYAARARAGGYGVSTVLLLLTMMHTGLLGALLTFAPQPLYPAYGDGPAAFALTPLEDQQLAGLIMWVTGGIFYLVAGVALAAVWLRDAERRAFRRGVVNPRT